MGWHDSFKSCIYYKPETVLKTGSTLRKKVEQYANNGLILEEGAGSGWNSFYLTNQSLHVVALDLQVESLKRHNNDLLDIVKADIFHLPFRNHVFSAVFSQGVYEHYSDNKIKQAWYEAFRTSSKIVFEVPTEKWIHAESSVWTYGDERFLPIKTWVKLIHESKFIVHEMYGWGWLPKYKRLLKILKKINAKIHYFFQTLLSNNVGFIISESVSQ